MQREATAKSGYYSLAMIDLAGSCEADEAENKIRQTAFNTPILNW
ncbi:MAG: hypothetical protein ABI729_07405 [Chitinophagales bacterium]